MQPSEDNLKTAMQNYTNWLDEQHHKLQNVDQTVDQQIIFSSYNKAKKPIW
jgi:hypothetical protein